MLAKLGGQGGTAIATPAELRPLADLLRTAQPCVVLTGAGMSTASGIPDFRGPGGLWRSARLARDLSLRTLSSNPRRFYRRALPLFAAMHRAQPNAGHLALARLEQAGLLQAVITQNIDGLHQRAGSSRVLELHGHLRTASCTGCLRRVPFPDLVEKVARGELPPLCKHCTFPLRPDVVLFGDLLGLGFEDTRQLVKACGLLLVVGSSLEVTPAAYLPMLTRRLAIINRTPTPLDSRAQLVVRGEAAAALEALAREVVA
ncbi:MAG: Sir2 family NAD-dependent protein deacetylase [Bacillota bacterium]